MPDEALAPIVITLLVLGVGRGLLTFLYRYGLYKDAYRIEYDLRTIMYEHLTRMSFAFYDRAVGPATLARTPTSARSRCC